MLGLWDLRRSLELWESLKPSEPQTRPGLREQPGSGAFSAPQGALSHQGQEPQQEPPPLHPLKTGALKRPLCTLRLAGKGLLRQEERAAARQSEEGLPGE